MHSGLIAGSRITAVKCSINGVCLCGAEIAGVLWIEGYHTEVETKGVTLFSFQIAKWYHSSWLGSSLWLMAAVGKLALVFMRLSKSTWTKCNQVYYFYAVCYIVDPFTGSILHKSSAQFKCLHTQNQCSPKWGVYTVWKYQKRWFTATSLQLDQVQMTSNIYQLSGQDSLLVPLHLTTLGAPSLAGEMHVKRVLTDTQATSPLQTSHTPASERCTCFQEIYWFSTAIFKFRDN